MSTCKIRRSPLGCARSRSPTSTVPFERGRSLQLQFVDPDLNEIEFHIDLVPGSRYWDERKNRVFIKSAGGKPDFPSE